MQRMASQSRSALKRPFLTPFDAKIQQKTDDRQYGAAPPRPLKFAGACGIEHFKGEDVGAPGNIAAQHHADAHLALGSRDAPQQLRAMACTSMASARREAAKARLQSSKRYCPKQGKNGLSGGGGRCRQGAFYAPMPALRSISFTALAIWRPSVDSFESSRSTLVMPLITVEWRRLNFSPISSRVSSVCLRAR